MGVNYDDYYQTENLFGDPYPELVRFFTRLETRGKVLDLGCGQGRDSIALARMGYYVTGVDHSEVGIRQLNKIAQQHELSLKGLVADIYEYQDFGEFDVILLDSMFHFAKGDKEKELGLLESIINEAKGEAMIVICIQDSGKKMQIFEAAISGRTDLEMIHREGLIYRFEDQTSNHHSESKYEMVAMKKLRA